MSKRFTDTEKWKDTWFDGLSCHYKLAWFYMLDTCDIAGVWDVNLRHLSFNVGHDFEYAELKRVFKDRILEIEGDKWFIEKFSDFQYGELKETCKPHLAVIKILKKHSLKGYSKGIDTLKDKDKDIDKDKEKDEDRISLEPYNNVRLTPHEIDLMFFWLADKKKIFRSQADIRFFQLLNELNGWFASHPKEMKNNSHKHTLQRWVAEKCFNIMPDDTDKAYYKNIASKHREAGRLPAQRVK